MYGQDVKQNIDRRYDIICEGNGRLELAIWSNTVGYLDDTSWLNGQLHSANIMLTISIRYSVVFVFLYPHISRNTKALVLAGASFFVSVNSVKDVKDKKEDF